MKVILLQDIPKVGEEGDVVGVKNGYGRNFLIPQGLAVLATDSAIKHNAELKRQASRKLSQKKEEQLKLAEELSKAEVVVEVKVGAEDRIFGTVTPTQVAVQLAAQGFEIDRRTIEIKDEIKALGVYTAEVRLSAEAIGKVKVRVEGEKTEAAEAPVDAPAEATEAAEETEE